MEFEFDFGDFHFGVSANEATSEFDRIFKSLWTKASLSGICRYQLTDLHTKILPGKYGFVCQLNPLRAQQRRKPQDLQRVNTSFNHNEFNFNLVKAEEILIKPRNRSKDNSESNHESQIIINVSPLEFSHSLLVPFVNTCTPQRVTLEGLELLFQVMLLSSDPNLKSGFNSPGGYASVNHQHYHLYYLQQRLYLETVDVEHIAGPCYALTNFPSKGFAFQLVEGEVSLLSRNVHTLVTHLREKEIAHNLFVTRGRRFEGPPLDSGAEQGTSFDTLRVFVWARQSSFGVKEEIGFNPALCELAGHLLIKEPGAFETVTEDQVSQLLDEITSPWFQQMQSEIGRLYPASNS